MILFQLFVVDLYAFKKSARLNRADFLEAYISEISGEDLLSVDGHIDYPFLNNLC